VCVSRAMSIIINIRAGNNYNFRMIIDSIRILRDQRERGCCFFMLEEKQLQNSLRFFYVTYFVYIKQLLVKV